MVVDAEWDNHILDKLILNSCGCYRTKEEAVAKAKEMLDIEKLKSELEKTKAMLKAREYHPYNNSTRFI
jgi:hypothetical protein